MKLNVFDLLKFS